MVLAPFADEHRVAMTASILHAVAMAAAKLMRAFCILTVFTTSGIQVKLVVFCVKRHRHLGRIAPNPTPFVSPEAGDRLLLVLGREDVLIFRVAMAQPGFALAVAVVLAVPAVLALHGVVEIAG